MRNLTAMLAAAVLALLPGVAAAQIGEPPESVLNGLEPYAPNETEGGYATTDLSFAFVTRAGAVYQITGESTMTQAGLDATASLVGAGTGYGPGIAQPVAQFLASDRLGELAGRGPVRLGVEEYLLELEVTGSEPHRIAFTLELQEIPAEAFPESRHSLGPADAKYVIREFSDFQCPFCARYNADVLPMIKETLLARGDVRFEFHHFPLVTIHANAQLAAEAAECVTAANDPEAFWTYHDALFARQQAWKGLGEPTGYFVRLAEELGLESERVEACLEERRFAEQIQTAYQHAGSLGLTGTPSVFVDGYKVANFGSLDSYLRAMELVDAFAE